MLKNRSLLLPVFLMLGIATVVSCGRSDKQGIIVPKDAGIVIHINAPSLSSKLTWAEIKATNWFSELHKNADDSIAKQLLDNPESSGINTSGDLAFFMKKQGRSGYFVFEGLLKDAAAFENFNKKINKDVVASKDGDLNILKDKDGIVTWDGTRFMYVASAPEFGGNRYMDDASFDQAGGGKLSADSLIGIAKGLYKLESKQSLFSDKRFEALIKESGDLHLWVSAEHMSGDMPSSVLSMMKLNTLLEGNVTAANVNFENGKIVMKSKSYYNDELAKVYEKYKMKNVDAALLNRIPSQNIASVLTFNYPPEGLKEFMKVIGVDGMVNGFMGEVGYSVEEFAKANKGDVLLAVTDFSMQQQVMPNMKGMENMPPMSISRPDFQLLFATSINDKAAFDKMVGIVKAKVGDLSQGGSGLPPISYSMNDNWFAAGTSNEQVNTFLAGGNNNWSAASKLGGHPMIFYVDLQKVLQPFAVDTTSRAGGIALSESLKMWQDVLFTGGEIVDGAMNANFEINLVDKSTNSLKQLNQYIDRLSLSRKQPF